MAGNKSKRIIVLDTNIPLIDPDCCKKFKEHMVMIPLVVLTEIDKFKKGHETINQNARKFARFIDALPSKLYDKDGEGVQVNEHGGRVFVLLPKLYHPKLKEHFPEQTNDHKILNAAYQVSQLEINKKKEIVLVSNDVNLRISAKSLGLMAEDYKTEIVQDVDSLNKDIASLALDSEILQNLHHKQIIDYNFTDGKNHNNECFALKQISDKQNGLAIYKEGKLEIVKQQIVYEQKSRNAEQAFALKILMDRDIRLVSIGGKAGTGKTFLAIIAALAQLGHDDSSYRQILYTRPTVSVGNKELGYTPGDVRDKLEVYMGGFFDNMNLIKELSKGKNKNIIETLLREEKENDGRDVNKVKRLALEPISLIRGRSLTNLFFIIDEAQNLTRQEIKTIVTRMGENTKMVFLGDVTQIDHQYLDRNSNGFVHLIDEMTGDVEYAHCFLKKGERSGLAERAAEKLG